MLAMNYDMQLGASNSHAAPDELLLPARRVWERYGTTSRTLSRWISSEDLSFPKPIIINSRRYWRESELLAWERSRARAIVVGE
jgi:predicted DNA-binding transcriptional regulator AlpA